MSGTDREYLPNSAGCFCCGDENESGIRARFFVDGDAVNAEVVLPRHMNGYRDVAHGGVLAALLDESMGWAATVFGRGHTFYVTAELTVKYLRPVPVGELLRIASRLVEDAGRIAYGAGELSCGGKVLVKASGKFIPMSAEGTAGVVGYLKFGYCRRYRTLFGRAPKEQP